MSSHFLIRYFVLFFEKFLEKIPDVPTSSLNEWLTFKKYLEYFPSSLENIHSLIENMFNCHKKTTLDQLENIKRMSKSKWLLDFKHENENHIIPQKKESNFQENSNLSQNLRQSRKKTLKITSEKNHLKSDLSPNLIDFSKEKEPKKSQNKTNLTSKHHRNLTILNPFLAIRTLSNRSETELLGPQQKTEIDNETEEENNFNQEIRHDWQKKNHRRSKSNILFLGQTVIIN